MEQSLAVALMIIVLVITLISVFIWMSTQNLWKSYGLIAGVLTTVVFTVIFGIGMALEWQGMSENACIEDRACYCERQDLLNEPAAIKQPVNALTAYFPIFAGLIILAWADFDRIRRNQHSTEYNPMKSGGYFPIAFGLTVVLLGVGSMFFHITMTEFLGALDPASIVLFILFIFWYDLWRILKLDNRSMMSAFGHAALWLGSTGLAFIFIFSGLTDETSVVTIALVIVLELVIAFAWYCGGLNGLRRLPGWALGILFLFVLAVFFWLLSQTDAQLCDQNSVLQGHALWHLLAMGIAPLMFFLMFRNESRHP